MGAHAEWSSPSSVCIPQKSLAITRDFWNRNSLGLTTFCMGTRDGFSMYHTMLKLQTCFEQFITVTSHEHDDRNQIFAQKFVEANI